MKKAKIYFVFLFVVFMLVSLLPSVSDAALVKCGNDLGDSCDFNDLLALVSDVISFILFGLAVPIAAIMFAYAGIMLLTSGGNSGRRSQAKEIFWNVAIGFILAVAAWLIVTTVLSVLGYDGWNPFE